MITLLLIIPLIGCLCLIPIKEREDRELSLMGLGDTKIVGQKKDAIMKNPEVLQYVSETVYQNKRNKNLMKQIALLASLLNLLISILL
jgi:hypothetical protein